MTSHSRGGEPERTGQSKGAADMNAPNPFQIGNGEEGRGLMASQLVRRDNQDENRIASGKNVPERLFVASS
jgi:hypothetical protein